MSRQSCSIYWVPKKGYYVLAIVITDKGLPVEAHLVRNLPSDAPSHEIWHFVADALARFGQRAPHTVAISIGNAWRQDHGFKSWRDFAEDAVHCSVGKTELGYVFRKGEWDGRGFGPADGGKIELSLNAAPAELADTLVSLIVPK